VVIDVAAVIPRDVGRAIYTLIAEASTPSIQPVVRTFSHVRSLTMTLEKSRRAINSSRWRLRRDQPPRVVECGTVVGRNVLGLVILYWIIRFAVAHGTGDALRRDRLLREEIAEGQIRDLVRQLRPAPGHRVLNLRASRRRVRCCDQIHARTA
jgi:hypothetical protein